jgi:YHS domain-containing protein
MKKLTLLAFLTLFFSAFSFADDPINSSTFGSVAIDGYDTVAYWTENKAVEGEKKFTYKFKDAKWRFATKENMELFKADPEKYMPQYGGYCAWAMSGDKLASVDGEAWTMYEGKLYLNYNKRVMKDWREEKARFVKEANGYYKARFPNEAQSANY